MEEIHMKFGYFNDQDKEYVITSPATPLPWINYLGNENFFSLISNTCGGYSFYKDAKLLRLTRYRYNNVPADTNGRYYFIKHRDTVWTPGWQPVKTPLDSYECRHGLGYSRFLASKNGIRADLTAFVPLHESCEINRLVLTNDNASIETLDLTSYVEFCFWNAVDDSTNFQRNLSLGEVEIHGSEIYHKTEYRERRNHFAYYTVNAEIDGFDTSRDDFLGVYGSIEHPKNVYEGTAGNSVASGGAVIGSHHLKVTLAPGESKSFIFILGYSENPYEDKWEAPNVIKKDRARQRILDIAATQFEDGSAYHQYQPLTKKGNSDIGSGFNDDPLWLIAGTSAYIKETGDLTILEEMVDFDNDPSLAQPLMEHLRRSFNYTLTHLGPHGLPLIGRADWNDCLNLNCFSREPGESFQTFGPSEGPVAESVFIAGMFVKYGREYAEICRLTGQKEEGLRADEAVEKMYQTVLDAGWDGEWFIRAYDAFREKVGSDECEEGKIYIEPQGFCVLADIGIKEGHAKKALDSVKERLDTKYGIVLQQPAYTKYYVNLGEISSYPPGYKENAGIFCHNNPWVSIAETRIGRGDRAFQIYRRTCPAYIEDISEIHRTEPYVYSQMIAGKDAPKHGEAKNSWLTGTAAWTFVNVSQYILGIRPSFRGLEIDPCIPSDLEEFTVIRKYRGAEYHIHVQNPDHVQKGIRSVKVNGKPVENTCLLPSEGIKKYTVEVLMG